MKKSEKCFKIYEEYSFKCIQVRISIRRKIFGKKYKYNFVNFASPLIKCFQFDTKKSLKN